MFWRTSGRGQIYTWLKNRWCSGNALSFSGLVIISLFGFLPLQALDYSDDEEEQDAKKKKRQGSKKKNENGGLGHAHTRTANPYNIKGPDRSSWS